MTTFNPTLILSGLGCLFVAYTIFTSGRLFERHVKNLFRKRTTRAQKQLPTRNQKHPAFNPNDLTGLRTPEEITRALANEINKGKKGDPDRVEFLVKLTNAGRATHAARSASEGGDKLRVVS